MTATFAVRATYQGASRIVLADKIKRYIIAGKNKDMCDLVLEEDIRYKSNHSDVETGKAIAFLTSLLEQKKSVPIPLTNDPEERTTFLLDLTVRPMMVTELFNDPDAPGKIFEKNYPLTFSPLPPRPQVIASGAYPLPLQV